MSGILLPRRTLLFAGGASLMVAPWLRPLNADEVGLDSQGVQFRPEIEPLVRLIEQTSRENLFREIAMRIRSGTSYTELLAATLLAGIRNVQPRPNVGFKFHCVMVMHAAHQATLAAQDDQRWFPLFWSMDYFKRCQEQDRNEGDWTMSPPTRVAMSREQSLRELQHALDQWDVEKADIAVTSAAAQVSSARLLELFAKYGTRDFRNIGHKAIWVSGAFRTLEVIGWEHAEPVLRSLTYALLNHNGEPNPAENDLAADRSGRANSERAAKAIQLDGAETFDAQWVKEWIQAARTQSPDELAESTHAALNRGIAGRSVFDALQCGAAELVMRQPAIVALHAITSTNAIHHLYRSVGNEELRRWLALQNASFLAHFRDAAAGRGELGNADILQLQPIESSPSDANEIFQTMGADRAQASAQILGYLQQGGSPEALLRKSRELIFLKGTDSHDYKYSSAIFEEYRYCSAEWRPLLLAAGSQLLTSSQESDNGLKDRIAEAFA